MPPKLIKKVNTRSNGRPPSNAKPFSKTSNDNRGVKIYYQDNQKKNDVKGARGEFYFQNVDKNLRSLRHLVFKK